MAEKGKTGQRIDGLMATLLILAALGADFLQTLALLGGPFLGSLISLIAFTFFSCWFFMLGVSYLDRNGAVKFVIWMCSFIVEFIPILNTIPAITMGVVSLVLMTRFADGKDSALFKLARRRRAKMDKEQLHLAERRALDYQARDAMGAQYRRVESKQNNDEE